MTKVSRRAKIRSSVPRILRTGSPASRNQAKPRRPSFVSRWVVWVATAPKRPARHQSRSHHHDSHENPARPLDSQSSDNPCPRAASLTPGLSAARIRRHSGARKALARPAPLCGMGSKKERCQHSRSAGALAIASNYCRSLSRERECCRLTQCRRSSTENDEWFWDTYAPDF